MILREGVSVSECEREQLLRRYDERTALPLCRFAALPLCRFATLAGGSEISGVAVRVAWSACCLVVVVVVFAAPSSITMLSRRRQPWELAAVLLVVVAGVDAWSVGATLEEVPAGSLVSLPFELPAFINNSLTLTLEYASTAASSARHLSRTSLMRLSRCVRLSQSPAEEGVFLFSVCLNRNANAAPPFDASGEFSLDNWSTCFAQYPSITTASVVRNITFVPTGMVFVSIYVNTAPANFSIALTLSGDQCDDGWCRLPAAASLPIMSFALTHASLQRHAIRISLL